METSRDTQGAQGPGERACSLLLTVLLQEAANRGLTRSAKLCFEMNVWKLFRIFTGEQGEFFLAAAPPALAVEDQ